MNRTALLVVFVIASATAGALPALAADDYDLDASPAVDTPTRTVDFEGQSYTISSVARVDPGERVSVSVTAPSGEASRVLLYDADRDIVDFRRATGSETVEFETGDAAGPYEPGSYMLVLSQDGVHRAAQPLVLSAYRVDVTAPGSGVEGESVEVSASIEPVVGDEPLESVTVVIGDDQRDRRVELDRTADGEYAGSVDLDGLPPGDYRLHAVAQGPDEVFDRPELIGVSDSQSFEVTAGETHSDEPAESGGGGGGSSGSADNGDVSTETPTETPLPTDTPGDGSTATPTDDQPSTETDGGTDTATGDVISPSGETSPDEGDTAALGGLDWRYLSVPVLAILLLLLWVRR